jgi:hypothetical protein
LRHQLSGERNSAASQVDERKRKRSMTGAGRSQGGSGGDEDTRTDVTSSDDESDEGETSEEEVAADGESELDFVKRQVKLLSKLAKKQKQQLDSVRHELTSRQPFSSDMFIEEAPGNPYQGPESTWPDPYRPQLFRVRDRVFDELQKTSKQPKEKVSARAKEYVTIHCLNYVAFNTAHFIDQTVGPILQKAKAKEVQERLQNTFSHFASLLATRGEYLEERTFAGTSTLANFLDVVDEEIYAPVLRGAPLPGGVIADLRQDYVDNFRRSLLSASAKKDAAGSVNAAAREDPPARRSGTPKKTRRGGKAAKERASNARQAEQRRNSGAGTKNKGNKAKKARAASASGASEPDSDRE